MPRGARRRQHLFDRFLDKVGPPDGNECRPWIAKRDWRGYGVFWFEGKQRLAHRVAYLLFVGPLDPELTIDHLCNNRACVNPAHLEQKSVAANIARRRLCNCGSCRRCVHREYMRAWSQRPENAQRVRDSVARRSREKRAAR